MRLKIGVLWLVAVAAILCGGMLASAAPPIYYQGRLDAGSEPANGTFDFRFILFSAEIGGSQIGGVGEVTTVQVSQGLFVVELPFGDEEFDGADRWLEIAVRGSGEGVYTVLQPRQRIGGTPYALRAFEAISAETAAFATEAGHAATATNAENADFATQAGHATTADSALEAETSQVSLDNVLRAGDTMTGPLALPEDGLLVGSNQLVANDGNIGIGGVPTESELELFRNGDFGPGPTLRLHAPEGNSFAFKMQEGVFRLIRNTGDLDQSVASVNSAGQVVIATGSHVGISTSNPTSHLHANASIAVRNRLSVSGNAIQNDDFIVFVDTASFNREILLPLSSEHPGRLLFIARVSNANTLGIQTQDGDSINGSISSMFQTPSPSTSRNIFGFVSTGSTWRLIIGPH